MGGLTRRLLRLLVTSLVVGGASSAAGGPLAVRSCCHARPALGPAWSFTCDCPDTDTMTIRKNEIPPSVRSVTIRNTRRVVLERDAISGLRRLTNLTLDGLDQLDIRRDGMASHNQTRLRLVKMQNVGSLRVEGSAFSGVWLSETTIRMQNVGHLTVESNAFDFHVSDVGPSVSLQHVGRLELEPNGFAAPLYGLSLYNVTMDACRGESFGGDTLYTKWNNVTINFAEARCFHSLNDFASFTVRSLIMSRVHHQAFSGNVREFTVEDSRFITIQERGFDIRVASMEITKSSISELRPEGLSVLATETLWLERVRIDLLRKNALIGLRMQENKELDPMLTIRKLELIKTENGSLTFAECTKIRLTDVNLVAPWPRICPTEKWAQALSGGGVAGQLSPAQYQLFFQLFRRRMCLEDGWTKFPAYVENTRCTVRREGDDGELGDSSASLDEVKHTSQDWINQDEAAVTDASSEGMDDWESARHDISREGGNGDAPKSEEYEDPNIEHTSRGQASHAEISRADVSSEDSGNQDGDARDGISRKHGDGNVLDQKEHKEHISLSSSEGAISTSSAGSSSKKVAARAASKMARMSAPDTTKFYDQNEEKNGLHLDGPQKPVVNVVLDVAAVEVQVSAKEAIEMTASREPAASGEFKEAVSSLDEMKVLRRRDTFQTLSDPDDLTSLTHHADQLLLWLVLGAAATLCVVLILALLLLVRRHRGHDPLDAPARSLMERMLAGEDVETGRVRARPGDAPCPSGHSAGPVDAYHHYEVIKEGTSGRRSGQMVRGALLASVPVGPSGHQPFVRSSGSGQPGFW